jgi:signal peptidase I
VAPDLTDPTLVAGDTPSTEPVTAAGAGGGNGEGRTAAATPARSHWLREILVVVLVALAVALLLRVFVVQTFFIPSGSMEPTLQVGDRILVNKLSYHLHGVGRGDIVVFSRPPAENCGGAQVNDLVKRVIGLPGESVSLSHGHVLINGKVLHETWLPSSVQGVTVPGPPGTPYSLTKPYLVPANHYFMMGDNRTESCDSRYWGPIDKSLIVGKVDVRVWPLTAFRFF